MVQVPHRRFWRESWQWWRLGSIDKEAVCHQRYKDSHLALKPRGAADM